MSLNGTRYSLLSRKKLALSIVVLLFQNKSRLRVYANDILTFLFLMKVYEFVLDLTPNQSIRRAPAVSFVPLVAHGWKLVIV